MGKKEKIPIYSGAGPEKVAVALRELMDFQDEGMSLPALEDLITQKLIPHFVRYDLPEFHSLYNFFPEEGAEFGAKIALHYNQGVTNWIVSPGAVMVEELCTQAFCRMFARSRCHFYVLWNLLQSTGSIHGTAPESGEIRLQSG